MGHVEHEGRALGYWSYSDSFGRDLRQYDNESERLRYCRLPGDDGTSVGQRNIGLTSRVDMSSVGFCLSF